MSKPRVTTDQRIVGHTSWGEPMHEPKKYCRHVWSKGVRTAKWICDKCGGYYMGELNFPPRGTSG